MFTSLTRFWCSTSSGISHAVHPNTSVVHLLASCLLTSFLFRLRTQLLSPSHPRHHFSFLKETQSAMPLRRLGKALKHGKDAAMAHVKCPPARFPFVNSGISSAAHQNRACERPVVVKPSPKAADASWRPETRLKGILVDVALPQNSRGESLAKCFFLKNFFPNASCCAGRAFLYSCPRPDPQS